MATVPFIGFGHPIEAFNISHLLVNKPITQGEIRLRTAFPASKRTLDLWRRAAMQYAAEEETTGSSDISTRARAVLLFAHESDLATLFYEINATTSEFIEGYYVDKRKTFDVDADLRTVYSFTPSALAELKAFGTPEQYVEMLNLRLNSRNGVDRVAGLCAAVLLSGIYMADSGS